MINAPALRSDLIIIAQQYRGDESYIVKDPETHKYFRFKPLEVFIMQEFTGEKDLPALAADLREQGIPVQTPALERFADRLSGMGLLKRTLSEKSTLLIERLRAERRRRVKQTSYEGSLLRMRWSAGDPDKLFDRWMPVLKWFFTPTFITLSAVLFATYFVTVVIRWQDVTRGIMAIYTGDFYTLENIILFWGTAMVVIVIHELGHGVTCKYFGGEVHEMGAMLLYFQPAFYCNVNDAWTFPKLSHRLWVTAAGSWIQLVVAGIAAIIWMVVSPDTVVAKIAFFAVLMGGATTILANANPLIPLDGYYALSDYLEVPNLRHRALGYIAWLVKRYVIRLNLPEPPIQDYRERRILLIYGSLAAVYILFILGVVAALAMGKISEVMGTAGVIAFVVLLWTMLRNTLREWTRSIVTSIRQHRAHILDRRVVRWGLTGLSTLLLLGILLPWPLEIRGRFVVIPLRSVSLVATDSAVLTQVLAGEGDMVRAGTVVARLRNFDLERRLIELKRIVDSLDAEALRARGEGSGVRARRAELARDQVIPTLRAGEERVRRLTLRAPVPGIITTPRFAEALGKGFGPGETVANLAATDSVELEVVLNRNGAAFVTAGQHVSLMPYADTRHPVSATISNLAPTVDSVETVVARVRMQAQGLLAPGVTGEARITVKRSNLLGAFWWAIRKRLRNDLLL